MNYLNIVFQGYYSSIDQESLKKYFIRKFKEAEKESFDAEEFFGGCQIIIKTIKQQININYENTVNEQKSILKYYKDQLVSKNNKNSTKTNGTLIEKIKSCELNLKVPKKETTLSVHQLTGGMFSGSMNLTEVNQLERIINKAYVKCNPNQELQIYPFKSFTRAIAIYYRFMIDQGLIEAHNKNIIAHVKEMGWINPKTGKKLGDRSIILTLFNGKDDIDPILTYHESGLKKDFPKDYDYALNLNQ